MKFTFVNVADDVAFIKAIIPILLSVVPSYTLFPVRAVLEHVRDVDIMIPMRLPVFMKFAAKSMVVTIVMLFIVMVKAEQLTQMNPNELFRAPELVILFAFVLYVMDSF